MDGVLERLLCPRQTATEYWLATFPTHEVRMNESGLFANAGDILVTNGFNGCTALIVRAELPDGQVKVFLLINMRIPTEWMNLSQILNMDNYLLIQDCMAQFYMQEMNMVGL